VTGGTAADGPRRTRSVQVRSALSPKSTTRAERQLSRIPGTGARLAARTTPQSRPPRLFSQRSQGLLALHQPANSYWRNGSSSGVPLAARRRNVHGDERQALQRGCCFDYGNSETDRNPTAPAPWTRYPSARSPPGAPGPIRPVGLGQISNTASSCRQRRQESEVRL